MSVDVLVKVLSTDDSCNYKVLNHMNNEQ